MLWKGIGKVIYPTHLQNLNGSLSKLKVIKGLIPHSATCDNIISRGYGQVKYLEASFMY